MYKILLCWRYLLSRYLALVCIVSVMLGVATLIVVNSVMSGFSMKLQDRLHGLLSDVVIETGNLDGFANAEEKMEKIRQDPYLNKEIVAMAPALEVFAMLQFRIGNHSIHRHVRLIGVDPEKRAALGGFSEHLIYQQGEPKPSFEISGDAKKLYQNRLDWLYKRADFERRGAAKYDAPDQPPPPAPTPRKIELPQGVIVGNLIASYRQKLDSGDTVEKYMLHPGDEIVLTTVNGVMEKPRPVYDRFIVVDYFKSEMSEYDSNYVFVPLEHLQKLRSMEGRVTSIQMKLRDYGKAEAVVAALERLFPELAHKYSETRALTWEKKQGPLLQAIAIEKGILNVLLFLIICVAGFGILAIFSMIVTEKTRDIGIMKALGASNMGVMKIFLGYGLLLGVVGAGFGTVLGLALTDNINQVERFLSSITGGDVFPRDVYYFDRIPTYIDVLGITLINVGSVAIAVLFSILPALRAAMLHPVKALRYE